MAVRWIVVRNGKTHGPFELKRLKQLAAEGKLRPSDSLIPEGSRQATRADAMAELFSENASALEPSSGGHTAPVGVTNSDPLEPEASPNTQPPPRLPRTWKSKAVDVARVTALTAERAAIVGVRLPTAYEKLGQQYFDARDSVEVFKALYEDLDNVRGSLEHSRKGFSQAKSPLTLSGRVRDFMGHASRVAGEQQLKIRYTALLRQLGMLAYERLRTTTATPEQQYDTSVAVRLHRERLSYIDHELAVATRHLSSTHALSHLRPSRQAISIGAVLVSAVLCWVVLRPFLVRSDPALTSLAATEESQRSDESGKKPVASAGSISFSQFEAIRKGITKFQVEDSLGTPRSRDTKLDQQAVVENGQRFGTEFTTCIVYHYQVTGKRSGLATFVFAGKGTNPPLIDKVFRENAAPVSTSTTQDSGSVGRKADTKKEITVIEAQQLIKTFKNGIVELESLATLSPEVAAVLAQHEWVRINGLKTLSREAAECFVRKDGDNGGYELAFDGLESLTPQVAAALARTGRKTVSLRGVRKLDAATAASLAGTNSKLDLSGLNELTVEVAAALANHKNDLRLNGLKNLTPDAAKAIAAHGLKKNGFQDPSGWSRSWHLELRGLVLADLPRESLGALSVCTDNLFLQ